MYGIILKKFLSSKNELSTISTYPRTRIFRIMISKHQTIPTPELDKFLILTKLILTGSLIHRLRACKLYIIGTSKFQVHTRARISRSPARNFIHAAITNFPPSAPAINSCGLYCYVFVYHHRT